MASKQAKKLQKKVSRADKIRKQAIELRLKKEKIEKIKQNLGQYNVWSDEVFFKMKPDVLAQLERNAKILRGLEEEFERDRTAKAKLNQELEEKGLNTLEEKLQFLHHQLVEHQKQEVGAQMVPGTSNAGMGGEVSEVEVIKAPVNQDSEETLEIS